ncbi:MAG: hypothetical protein WBV23_12315 [Desulfobaccales bacterium]
MRLVAQLLEERFDADFSFVNEKVITLDPGAGTGTYILAALQHGLHRVEQERGPSQRPIAVISSTQPPQGTIYAATFPRFAPGQPLRVRSAKIRRRGVAFETQALLPGQKLRKS